jgi:hypothetical protein
MLALTEEGALPVNSLDSLVCMVTLWWPIEVVPLQVQIVEPRKLTALEWALLRVMDEFRVDPPTLDEIAEELGLNDPGFLRDTLKDIIRLRVLEPRGTVTHELSDLTFTELGERLYRNGQIEAEPSTHGVTFFIDALTDEDLQEPQGLHQHAHVRFLEGEINEPRESIGLDRIRSVMHDFHKDILNGDAEVRAVITSNESVSVKSPTIRWRPVSIRISISPVGEILAEPDKLTKKALKLFANRDLAADGVLPTHPVTEDWVKQAPPLDELDDWNYWGRKHRSAATTVIAMTAGWGSAGSPRHSTIAAYVPWRRRISALVPAEEVVVQALQLLSEAKTEIVLHTCWGGADGIEKEIREAVKRGVRVLAVGALNTQVFAWENRTGIGLQVQVEELVTGALVVDGTSGLVIDDVQVKLASQPVAMELAGTLRGTEASKLRSELVRAALSNLPDPPFIDPTPNRTLLSRTLLEQADVQVNSILADERLRIALARLAFAPSESEATALVQLATTLAPGIENVPLMRSLVAAASTHAPALSPTHLQKAWSASWERVVAACSQSTTIPHGLIERLAIWAPPSVAAATYVDFAVAAWVTRAKEIEESGKRLVAIADAADTQWRRGVARACPSWRRACDDVLVLKDWSEETIKRRAALARQLLSTSAASAWAAGCIEKIPRPNSLAEIAMWGVRAEGLRELAGTRFDDRVTEIVTELVGSYPSEPRAILGAVGSLLPPLRLATLLLGETPSITSIARVREAFVQGAKEIADKDWILFVNRALPDWSASFNAFEHADELARIIAALSFPSGKIVLRRWALQLAAGIQRPVVIEGIVWWLGELRTLVPALGEEGVHFALSVVQEHAAALRHARTRGVPPWNEVREAWCSLGYSETTLNTILREPVVGHSTISKKSKKTNKEQKKKDKKNQ